MIVHDHRGVPQTVSANDELERIEKALIGILGMGYNPAPFYRRNEHEGSSLSLLQLECVDLISTMEYDKVVKAKELIKPYRCEDHPLPLSDRDQLLLDAIEKWIDRRYEEAHRSFSAILRKYPKDILTIFAVHMLEFYMGWTEEMKKTVDRVLPHWAKEDPLYGYLKGIEAFCLEENGFFAEAMRAAEEALDINRRDIYAIHAICHCFYETGQYVKGAKWMQDCLFSWKDNLSMRLHVWWHYALFNLYTLDLDKVYEVYRSEIRRKNDPEGLEDLDAVALLWRLRLIGRDDPAWWKDLFRCWKDYLDHSCYWFNDLHALLVFVANGEEALADRLIEKSIHQHCNDSYRERVASVLTGIRHFGEGRYRQAMRFLEPALTPDFVFGGSNAQRDILEMTALEAAIRAGEIARAKELFKNGRCFAYDSPLATYYEQRINREDQR